jgi:hypothetical protein
MSTTAEKLLQTEAPADKMLAGALGGIAGALVMGGLIFVMNSGALAVAIPSLYTLAPPPNPLGGLFVHTVHGAVLGVVFSALVNAGRNLSPRAVLVGGLGWGIVTWLLFAALVMPLWLRAIGSPASPPIPNFALPSLVWHAIYGLVLGGGYFLFDDWL